jgi:hypothetical protein
METTETLAHELIERRSSRRAAMMLGGAALAGMAFARPRNAAAQSTTLTDGDILNFALNLEYLEAQFYTLATAGTTIDKLPTNPVNVNGGGGGTGGTVTVKPNFAPVPFTTGVLQDYANETAQEERNHVSFLSGALATAAVAQPNLDLYNSFNALAQVAGLGPSFDPFASETNFLLGAFIFEDVGVTAYNGAATLLTSQAYLQAAAGILAVEAYHAGSIRTRIYAAGAGAQSASQLIASARASLSAAALTTPPSTPDDLGVSTLSNGAATIVDADANAITFSRTAAQVLSIVYGGSKPGVFYPNGLNGTIK